MKYAVLFKGINIGGKNIVKMNDLKQLLLELGLSKVKTYIQSGNAVFETAIDEETLNDMIYSGFAERFGFKSNAIIRSIDEIRALIDLLPFSTEEINAAEVADPQVEHLYVYFLDNSPEQSQIDAICKGYLGPDVLRTGKREVYLLLHQSIRKAKLAVHIAKTFDSATSRNWKTVNKFYDMLTNL